VDDAAAWPASKRLAAAAVARIAIRLIPRP
jgi:hypothetical protein